MKLEYTVDIVRGWPAEGAKDSVETIKTGSTLVNGDVVEFQPDGSVDKVGATKSKRVGLVLRGNGDTGTGAIGQPVTGTQAVVLWGNYIAKIGNFTGTPSVGALITAQTGKFVAGVLGTDDAVSVGFVKQVIAAEGANPQVVVGVFY